MAVAPGPFAPLRAGMRICNINLPVNYYIPLRTAETASVPVNSDRLLDKLPLAVSDLAPINNFSTFGKRLS